MKIINTFLLIMLIYATKGALTEFGDQKMCTDYKPGGKQAYSLDFCRTTSYDGYAACCFVKWEKNDAREYNCYPVTSEQWGDMDKAEAAFNTDSGASDIVSFDCSASYLYASLLVVFALLF